MTAEEQPIRYSSLAEILPHRQIDARNLPLVTKIVDRIGIEYFTLAGGYIKAHRRAGGRPLRIHPGYTAGFASEGDITDALGDVDRWENGRISDWGVTHPVNWIREGGSAQSHRQQPRTQVMCPDCHTQRAANGACLC